MKEQKIIFNQHKMYKRFFINKKSQSKEFKPGIIVGGQEYICINLECHICLHTSHHIYVFTYLEVNGSSLLKVTDL